MQEATVSEREGKTLEEMRNPVLKQITTSAVQKTRPECEPIYCYLGKKKKEQQVNKVSEFRGRH